MEANPAGMEQPNGNSEEDSRTVEQPPIDIGAGLENSGFINVTQQLSDSESANVADNRRKRGRPKGSRNKPKEEAQAEAAAILTTSTAQQLETAMSMLVRLMNQGAVFVARTDDAAMNFIEESAFSSAAIAIVSKESHAKRIANNAPYVVLLGSLGLWGRRVYDLRQKTNPRQAEPTLNYENQSFNQPVTTEQAQPEQRDISFIMEELNKISRY